MNLLSVRDVEYSLFIDESGKFDYLNGDKKVGGPWIIAGLLCPASISQAEAILDRALSPIAVYHGLAKEQFHLTKLRKPEEDSWPSPREKTVAYENRYKWAMKIAREVFQAILRIDLPIRFLVAANTSKKNVHDHKQNYRLMIMDLLGMLESRLSDDERLAKLDLMLATRRTKNKNNETIWITKHSEIGAPFLDALLPSVEVGLATRGLIDLASDRNAKSQKLSISSQQCELSWALIAADFCANIIANRDEKYEKQIISMLDEHNRLSLFNSFGDHENRKARICARDGDFIHALYWLSASYPAPDQERNYNDELKGYFALAARDGGVNSVRTAVEGLIELLWQQSMQYGNYPQILKQLERIETALAEIVYDEGDHASFTPILFRLRNFMIAIANHVGSVYKANVLLEKQASQKPSLTISPENFPLLLDRDLYAIETSINNLDFQAAERLAVAYHSAIEAYKVGWGRLSSETVDALDRSRFSVRAEMTLLRAQILNAPALSRAAFGAIWETIDRLEQIDLLPIDRSRLRNYRTMAQLKAGLTIEALRSVNNLDEKLNDYDVFWAIRSSVDAAIAKVEGWREAGRHALDYLRQHEQDQGALRDHPYELIYRERGCLEVLVDENYKMGQAWFSRSEKLHELNPAESEINLWLRGLSKWHSGCLVRKEADTSSGLEDFMPADSERCRLLARQAAALHQESGIPLLQCVRAISPY